MEFQEAAKYLCEGWKIKRKSWHGYLEVKDPVHQITPYDLEKDDWQIKK